MKNIKNKIVFLLGVSLLISCSLQLEKRLYTKGYYIQISRKKNLLLEKNNDLSTNEPLLKKEIAIQKRNEITRPLDITDDNALTANNATKSIIRLPKNYFKNQSPHLTSKSVASKNSDVNSGDINSGDLKFDSSRQKNEHSDGNLYLLAALMGASTFGLFRLNRPISLKATRWAKKNKLKSRGLIAVLQTGLGTIGVLVGKNLHELGYSFSNNLHYTFGVLMSLGFLNLILNEEKGKLLVLKSFYFRKISHLAIGLSLFATTIGIGNKIGEHSSQITPLGHAIEKMDTAFSPHDDSNSELKIAKRGGEAALALQTVGYIILGTFVLLGLIGLSCLAWCSGGTAVGLPVTIGCIALFVLMIGGMTNSIRNSSYKDS